MKKLLGVLLLGAVAFTMAQSGGWVFKDVVISGYSIATDEGEAKVNVPGFKNPYGVAVDPDGKVWAATYYSRRLEGTSGLHDTLRYPDLWYEIAEKDTGTGTYYDTTEIWNKPIWICDPSDGSVDTVRFLKFADGSQDTLTDGTRGIVTGPDGNIIYADKYALYQINYQTYEVMNKFDAGADQLACPAVDTAGYVYVTSLLGGTPCWILDPDDFSIYNTVTDNVEQLQRNITVSPDGKDVYFGTISGSNGILQFHSADGPDGTYAIADTIFNEYNGTTMALHFIQWDPAGLLWVGTVEEAGLKLLWALDPSDWAIVDTTSFTWWGNTTMVDTTTGGYAQPQYIRAPRDAAWSPDGKTMYIADFYSYTIKAFEYVEVGVEPDHRYQIPLEFSLFQNYPNPFNPTTTIPFDLKESGLAKLTVYDMLGREVAVLVNEPRQAGHYKVLFDATGLASGMYLYQLEFNNRVVSKRMMFMK